MHKNLPESQEKGHSRQKEHTHIRKGLRKNPTLIKELQVIWHDWRAWRTEKEEEGD